MLDDLLFWASAGLCGVLLTPFVGPYLDDLVDWLREKGVKLP